ncbi:MAG: tetratricopeptide repeat protein [Stomatobaculum sp.]|nr:tetratricopeptide repeat protein [Stomatobaculum sp.]
MAEYNADRPGRQLKPEDYADPQCPFSGEGYGVTAEVRSVPQHRIIGKLDEYMSRRDYAGAERHLLYWLEEAKLGKDLRGELMLRNELTGFYRKVREKEKALENAGSALELLKELGMEQTISAGTTYVNAATANNAFGENERSLELFRKAQAIFENSSVRQDSDRAEHAAASQDAAGAGVSPEFLGGLYNNMALAETALGHYAEAEKLYGKALGVMETVPGGEPEQAITWLNMAQTAEAAYGMEEEAAEKRIQEFLERAKELLDKVWEEVSGSAGNGAVSGTRKGYAAFVFETCSSAFQHCGWFAEAKKLKKRAEELYRTT